MEHKKLPKITIQNKTLKDIVVNTLLPQLDQLHILSKQKIKHADKHNHILKLTHHILDTHFHILKHLNCLN